MITRRSVRDALLAEEHQWVPNSGWVTFRVRSDKDLQDAIWLMRLSYFRYALKAAADPSKFFAEASEDLRMTPRFKSLLEPFMPLAKREDFLEPLTG